MDDEAEILAIIRDGFADAPKGSTASLEQIREMLRSRFPTISDERIVALVRQEASRHGMEASD